MKCSAEGCNLPYRVLIGTPGSPTGEPFCATHALFKWQQNKRSPERDELAPVIDIKTRKRIGSWSNRYAGSKYDAARQEYLAKFVYKGLKNTDAAKKFYAEQVLPHKPKPGGQSDTTSRDLTPSGPMNFGVAMSHPHYLGDGWAPGTGNPQIKEPSGE